MTVETFRLKALFVSRTRYPNVGLWSDPTYSTWTCHKLMGWACFGDRGKGLVTDHKGQDNKLMGWACFGDDLIGRRWGRSDRMKKNDLIG